jgi:type IV secretory pathway VirJ component
MASFAFRVASWFGGGGEPRYPTAPEIARVTVPITCIYGVDELQSVCRTVVRPRVRTEAVGQGHQFGGEYARLVELILQREPMFPTSMYEKTRRGFEAMNQALKERVEGTLAA